MQKLPIISLLSLMSLTCTARWDKKINGDGNYVTINRSVDEYDAVVLAGWFDVNLVDGEEGELILEGESNLLKHLITEVKAGQLTIKVENGINLKPTSWKDGIRITVPVEHIDAVKLSGSGDIVGKTTIKSNNLKTALSGSGNITLDIECDTIDTSMSGSGDINLSGSTKDFEVSISGSGDIKAYDLQADNVDATISGSADIKVTANKMLNARVSGSGDISYRGNPAKVDTKASGSGDISKG